MTLPSPQGGIPTKITKYSKRKKYQQTKSQNKNAASKIFLLAIAESFLSHLELFQKVFFPEASIPLQLFGTPTGYTTIESNKNKNAVEMVKYIFMIYVIFIPG